MKYCNDPLRKYLMAGHARVVLDRPRGMCDDDLSPSLTSVCCDTLRVLRVEAISRGLTGTKI